MIKKCLCCCFLLLLSSQAFSQTIGTYRYQGKNYLIYPYRIDNSQGIPLVGYKIPDGEYIAFTVFNFREKFSFRSHKIHRLTDTTVVAAVFNIRDNMAEGAAVLYEHYKTDKGAESKKPFRMLSGDFSHNLKTGLWTASAPRKKPDDYTNYQNGIKHGYHKSYDHKGQLLLKEKYCNGNKCDSVFTFRDGKPDEAYDIRLDNRKMESSRYEKGLSFLNLEDLSANTFYKKYDKKGILMCELKFKDGEVLPYDSIGITERRSLKYVTIKKAANGEVVSTYVSDRPSVKRIDQEYYSNYVYHHIYQGYNYKARKNPFTGKKQLIKKRAFSLDEYYVDPSIIEASSIVPVLAEKNIHSLYTEERYYIPRYRFVFDKNEYTSFAGIDSSRKLIFLNNQIYANGPSSYNIKYKAAYISKEHYDESVLQNNPYLEKAYLINTIPYDITERCKQHEFSLRDLETVPYLILPENPTYYKADTALNGRYYFSSAAKHRNWPSEIHYVGYTGFEKGFAKGSFVNGKKEGLWLYLQLFSSPKKTPRDLKAYGLSHPASCYYFREISHKDGLRDGAYTEYRRYNPKLFNDYGKEPQQLYKVKTCNYTRDTLNGMYMEYNENNLLKKQLNFVMGLPHGECIELSLYGEVVSRMYFNKGNLDGEYTRYRDRKMSFYANFKNNRLIDSLVYYLNGKRHLKLELRNDTLHSRFCYYPDGKIKELLVFNHNSGYIINEHSISSDNYIEILKTSEDQNMMNIQGEYMNYYDNGQLLSEGSIRNGELYGLWRFYAPNGMMIHKVHFSDTAVYLPHDTVLTEISGYYTGYYTTGVRRCTGYIKDLELSYDCFTKQEKADLDFYALDFFDINGKMLLRNGSGYFIKYDPNGLKVSAGKLVNCREDSLWKYYTPEQKLQKTGHYVNYKKEGVWYEGSLEGINFEDGACFNMDDSREAKAFESERKKLSIRRIIYKNGIRVQMVRFNSDLNKTYEAPGGVYVH